MAIQIFFRIRGIKLIKSLMVFETKVDFQLE